MNKNIQNIAIGVAIGYLLRDQIGNLLGKKEASKTEVEAAALAGLHMGALQTNPYGALEFGALQRNPHSALDQIQAFPRAAFGPEGYGLHHNPVHMGALQTNPYGALQTNPYGALALSGLHR